MFEHICMRFPGKWLPKVSWKCIHDIPLPTFIGMEVPWKYNSKCFFKKLSKYSPMNGNLTQSSFSECNIDCWRIFWIWNASRNLTKFTCLPSTNQPRLHFLHQFLPPRKSSALSSSVGPAGITVSNDKNEQSKKISVVEENINVLDFNCEKISDYQLFSHSLLLKYHDWTSECFRHDSNLVYRSLQDSLEWKQRTSRRLTTSFFFITSRNYEKKENTVEFFGVDTHPPLCKFVSDSFTFWTFPFAVFNHY